MCLNCTFCYWGGLSCSAGFDEKLERVNMVSHNSATVPIPSLIGCLTVSKEGDRGQHMTKGGNAVQPIRKLLQSLDTNGNGNISTYELICVLKNLTDFINNCRLNTSYFYYSSNWCVGGIISVVKDQHRFLYSSFFSCSLILKLN